MHRNRLLVALVALVGLIGVAPIAEAKPAVPSNGKFTALTYNVAGLPEQLSGSEPTTNSPYISPLLDAYDVVLLQENWQDVLHDQRQAGVIGDEVPATMFHHIVVRDADHAYRSTPKPHPNGVSPARLPTGPPAISDGLNRLSRLPFGEVVRVPWDRCHGELYTSGIEEALKQSGFDDRFDDNGLGAVNHETDGGAADCGAEKGFSVARTEVAPGVTVDIYNLHADAGSHPRDVDARADNFSQLAAFINQFSAGTAVIVGGDTNLKIDTDDRPDRIRDAEVWAEFQASTGVVDVCRLLDCGADAAVIDKFAVRDGSVLKLTPQTHHFERERFVRPSDGMPLSDHDALAVRFKWVRPGS